MLWLRRAWKAATTANDIHGLLTSNAIILPVFGTFITALSAFISPIPLPYLFVSCALAFASITTGLLRFDEWKQRTDPSGKLNFAHCFAEIVLDPPIGKPEKIVHVRFGFELLSNASFPMTFQVDSIETSFMGRISQETHMAQVIEVPPNGDGWWRDFAIPINAEIPASLSTGRMRFRCSYGKPGKMKNFIEKRIKIYAEFDEQKVTFRFDEE